MPVSWSSSGPMAYDSRFETGDHATAVTSRPLRGTGRRYTVCSESSEKTSRQPGKPAARKRPSWLTDVRPAWCMSVDITVPAQQSSSVSQKEMRPSADDTTTRPRVLSYERLLHLRETSSAEGSKVESQGAVFVQPLCSPVDQKEVLLATVRWGPPHQPVCARTLCRSGSCPLASGAVEYTSTVPVGTPPATYSCGAAPPCPGTTSTSLTPCTLKVRETTPLRTSMTETVSLRSHVTRERPSGDHASERFSSLILHECVVFPLRESLPRVRGAGRCEGGGRGARGGGAGFWVLNAADAPSARCIIERSRENPVGWRRS